MQNFSSNLKGVHNIVVMSVFFFKFQIYRLLWIVRKITAKDKKY